MYLVCWSDIIGVCKFFFVFDIVGIICIGGKLLVKFIDLVIMCLLGVEFSVEFICMLSLDGGIGVKVR